MRVAKKFMASMAVAGALGGVLWAAAFSLDLCTDQHQPVYTYAYPKPGSEITPQEAPGKHWINVSLKGDAWSGGGIGLDLTDLSPYRAKGALEFYVKGAKGGELFDIGFIQAKGAEKDAQAYQVTLPVASYAKVGKVWSRVLIPLKDFPAQGSHYSEEKKTQLTAPFNWKRVQEIALQHAPGGDAVESFSLYQIRILPNGK